MNPPENSRDRLLSDLLAAEPDAVLGDVFARRIAASPPASGAFEFAR